MRIAVMSDSHDNIWMLAKAIPHLMDVDVILHCGDLVSPFMLVRLAQGVGDIPVHIVWGNNDGDKRLLAEVASNTGKIKLHGEIAILELGQLRVAVNHYPKIARGLAQSGSYDLVCYGHDHTRHEEWIGNTLLLNPGELMGMQGPGSLAIYDSESRAVKFIEI